MQSNWLFILCCSDFWHICHISTGVEHLNTYCTSRWLRYVVDVGGFYHVYGSCLLNISFSVYTPPNFLSICIPYFYSKLFTRESSYCFQRVLAIAILSVRLSVT